MYKAFLKNNYLFYTKSVIFLVLFVQFLPYNIW